ncbi:MAG TPA: hypothetical protein VIR57_04705 [Chloroflexota bacterium]
MRIVWYRHWLTAEHSLQRCLTASHVNLLVSLVDELPYHLRDWGMPLLGYVAELAPMLLV